MILLKLFIYLTITSLVITVIAYLLKSWKQTEDENEQKTLKLPTFSEAKLIPEQIKASNLFPVFSFIFAYGLILCIASVIATIGLSLIFLAEAKTGYYLIVLAIIVATYFYIARKKRNQK